LKCKLDRRQNGHDKSPKKRKIRRKITTRKTIRSTIKIKTLPRAPALSLSLMCEPLVNSPIED